MIMPSEQAAERFSFYKGGEDVVAPKGDKVFSWDEAAALVRQSLTDAANARNLSFLFGSGCSSLNVAGRGEVGIPTMGPMAKAFLAQKPEEADETYITAAERDELREGLGLDVDSVEFSGNLERLMEYLHSARFVLNSAGSEELKKLAATVSRVISKITSHVLAVCTRGPFADGDESILRLYLAFYQKLVFRDRALPRPWVFTTNYDLFNETAMDRRGIPYCNGFSGTVERRFNPAVFRYTLAEQLDISSQKWSAVDGFIYLCKLHGSVNWIEDGKSLFPVREVQSLTGDTAERVMIYPTPAKQSASFASPYADLFREFHTRVVRDQSVLVTIGYSFGDEHINNIIFQALTIPNFRLIAFAPPDAEGVLKSLRELEDPRIWLIGGLGNARDRRAHYFDTFIESFMPDAPGSKVDQAVGRVLASLISMQPVGDEVSDGHG